MGTATASFILHAFFWFLPCDVTPVSSVIKEYGKLLPINPGVWVGDKLELTCALSDTIDHNVTEVWRHLYFKRGGNRIDVNVTKNSSRKINLRLHNIQIKDETTYYCYLNGSAGNQLLVGSQRIHVYHPPQQVEKIKCVVHNWARMRCTWDLGVKYHHPEHVSVFLYWVIETKGNSHKQSDCPHLTNTSCEWKENDGKNSFKPDMTYKMAVVVENTKMIDEDGQNKVGQNKAFSIDTTKIVKPAKVPSLHVQIRNSTCLSVEWKSGKRHYPKTCEIKLSSKWNNVEQSWNTTEQPEQSVGLCGLHPSAKYHITVSCRPRDNGGYYSDIAEIDATMPEDVPSGAPVLTVGSYKENPCAKQNCR